MTIKMAAEGHEGNEEECSHEGHAIGEEDSHQGNEGNEEECSNEGH